MTTTAGSDGMTVETKSGHPTGLYVLFTAEMWERFSYYGMRALLVLYLTKHLNYARPDALALYGTYTGLVYFTPLLGGFLADTFLGQRKAILIGGSLMALGHFAMAFEPLLNLALGLLILGNGFFKPNISTMVGQLYPQNDARRDSAYTIFYMGINLGAFFSPLVCGTLGEHFGWHYGFGAAGVGMVFGLITFALLQRTLGVEGFPPGRSGPEARLDVVDYIQVGVLVLLGAGLVYAAITPLPQILKAVPAYGWLAALTYWFGLALVLTVLTAVLTRIGGTRPELPSPAGSASEVPPVASANAAVEVADERQRALTWEDWNRILVIFIVAIFSIVFWMGFEQAGGTLTLFADSKTDRVVLGHPFPASWYQSLNPLLIFILAPLISILWKVLDGTRFKLTSTAKMGIALLLLGMGFAVMGQAEQAAARSKTVGPEWLAAVYLLNTVGELCISPIGLSLVNRLAPARLASLMMAVWFLCAAIANYLAGNLEHLLKESRVDLWTFLILTSVIPGVILLALTRPLRKMGHGRL